MEKLIGRVDVEVWVECPECGETIELLEIDFGDENIIGRNLFGTSTEPSKWDNLDIEIECPHNDCTCKFILNEFEY